MNDSYIIKGNAKQVTNKQAKKQNKIHSKAKTKKRKRKRMSVIPTPQNIVL